MDCFHILAMSIDDTLMIIKSIKRDTFDDLMELNHREARKKRLKRQKVTRLIVFWAKNVVRCSDLMRFAI